ncbi:unnamed protein product [Rotaria magnacalcarata]|uniref:FLYWCH-type domain-containing protein n=2 Tax=Rotaria magnacalcarata TaxID=392030 RepID=A0A819KWQ8_9BILA|nr:unnamed protein product [Rotaria magnacalcarata]CAF3951734.1 unnamed protein product [Rotaria magnacalcarata]
MAVTTRAAALRSQTSRDITLSLDQTTSTSASTTKTTRKCPSKHKEVKVQSSMACDQFEVSSIPRQQSTIFDTEATSEVIKQFDHEDNKLERELDTNLEKFVANEPCISPSSNKNCESTFSSPTSTGSTSTPVLHSTTASIKEIEDDHSTISLETSNNDENFISLGDSNALVNVPIIKGDITTGTSARGGKMVFMNGFGYLYMSTAKQSIGWRCAGRDMNCKAVIHTSRVTGEFDHWNGTFHCHESDSYETRKRNILVKIKNRALDEYIPIKIIVEEEYRKANLSVEEKRAMPLPAHIESGLHKLRRKTVPPLPQDQKFVVPPAYQHTYSNGNFLIYDKRKNAYGGRLMIFASDEQLNVLYNSDILFADGTFKVSPKLFEQLIGLMSLYENDPESRHLLRSFMALALLPIDIIPNGYELLKKEVHVSPQAEQLKIFAVYFESEWLNSFKPSTWSVSNSTWRTNNFSEAQNRRFFTRVVQPHPNLWRFIQCLKQEESVISHRMIQTGLGFSSTKPKKSTYGAARKTKQIQKLLNLLHSKQRSLIEITMSLAYLVGEPACRGKKGKKKKHNVSNSNSSHSSSCDSPARE